MQLVAAAGSVSVTAARDLLGLAGCAIGCACDQRAVSRAEAALKAHEEKVGGDVLLVNRRLLSALGTGADCSVRVRAVSVSVSVGVMVECRCGFTRALYFRWR